MGLRYRTTSSAVDCRPWIVDQKNFYTIRLTHSLYEYIPQAHHLFTPDFTDHASGAVNAYFESKGPRFHAE